jgi:hypothetical protein
MIDAMKPVAWWCKCNGRVHLSTSTQDDLSTDLDWKPLYTHPAKPWQGLSDEEVGRLTVFDGLHHIETPLLAKFIRAIEAELKEKNS